MTEQRKSEGALREAERRFRAVFNQQFQFMAILPPDGTVLEANETCFRATGIGRERVLGYLFWETPWSDRLPAMQEQWKRQVAEAARAADPSKPRWIIPWRTGPSVTPPRSSPG